jgi:hypothetical protein
MTTTYRMIRLWEFADAPKKYKNKSQNGGDEDYIIFVPDGVHLPHWIFEGSGFACCHLEEHKVERGRIFIGCHA